MSVDTLVALARLVATPEQWAGAALLLVALVLVRLGTRRPTAGPSSTPPRPPGSRRSLLDALPTVDLATLLPAFRRRPRAATPTPLPAPAARRITPRTLQGVDATVTRMARAGRDAGEIARQTGIARDAVRLVLLRDAVDVAAPGTNADDAPTRAATPVARPSADTRPRPAAPTTARPARPVRAMAAVDARRDPRMDDARERARAADAGRGSRFSAMVR
jgi:hypothetical protein